MDVPQFEITAQSEARHWWFVARRRILCAVIRNVLPPSHSRLVVDWGCGTGGNTAALGYDYRCAGVDCSTEALLLAQRRFPQAEFDYGALPEDVEGLVERADLILLADVLEHVADDQRLLTELIAQAHPGAYVLITVPADRSLWSRHDESHGHFRRYDRDRLARLWHGLPVTDLLLSYFNARLYPLVWATRTLGRVRGKSFGHADTDLHLPARPVNWLLTRIFAGEERRLLNVVRGKRIAGYRRGVSLIALLRREDGVMPASALSCPDGAFALQTGTNANVTCESGIHLVK